jgi:Cyclic nucleotide-binding domain
VVDGVSLETARGFEDLPAEVQLSLAGSMRIEKLGKGEEVSFFGAAIVTAGTVDILPAFSDESGAIAHEGDVIFTHGNLQDSIDLRVVAKIDDTRVAVWDPETLRQAISECPWVADELKLIADRYLAVCGATLGPLGEHLDDALRAAVFQRLEVRVYQEGEVLAEAQKPIPGLLIVGGGRVILRDAQGTGTGELNMGDFVFASGLLGGNKAPFTAVAAKGGTLVLAAPRQVAHELMMSVPPLVEVLAG